MNFYLCEGWVDMRKGIATLSELVRRKMHTSPESGDVFIFLGKDRRNIKILRHETNGYVLYWKKLDKERFLLPVFSSENDRYEITWDKLVLLLEGTVRKELLVG
jgi:transposase